MHFVSAQVLRAILGAVDKRSWTSALGGDGAGGNGGDHSFARLFVGHFLSYRLFVCRYKGCVCLCVLGYVCPVYVAVLPFT